MCKGDERRGRERGGGMPRVLSSPSLSLSAGRRRWDFLSVPTHTVSPFSLCILEARQRERVSPPSLPFLCCEGTGGRRYTGGRRGREKICSKSSLERKLPKILANTNRNQTIKSIFSYLTPLVPISIILLEAVVRWAFPHCAAEEGREETPSQAPSMLPGFKS